MNLVKSVPSLELSYDYRKADWNKVRSNFKEIHSLNEIDSDNPQELLDNLIFVIKKTKKQSFVLKPKRFNLKCQWDSKRIQKLAQTKRSKFIKYQKNPSSPSMDDYKKASKKLKKEVTNARKRYEKGLALNIKNNSKPFHAYISNRTKYKAQIRPLKVRPKDNIGDDILLQDEKEIATVINEMLGSVFIDDSNMKQLPFTPKLHCNTPLNNVYFREYQLHDVIKKLNQVHPQTQTPSKPNS